MGIFQKALENVMPRIEVRPKRVGGSIYQVPQEVKPTRQLFLAAKWLIEAARNHDQVVVFYLYKKSTYKNQEAQKWWLSKSLYNFQKKLNDLNINLEVIKADSYKVFFDKLFKAKDISIYWNKVYEPDYLKFDDYLLKNLKIKNIPFKI